MNSQIKDFYRVLDLEPGANLALIRQSYRQLVKVWHPDRFNNDQKLQAVANDKLKKINFAYESLVAFIECGGKTDSPKSEPNPEPPKASSKGSAATEIYNAAFDRYTARDYKGAANLFLQAAEMGDAKSQYSYGYVRYRHSLGHYGIFNATKHFNTILRWWTKAAEQGHTEAQFLVGTFHEMGFCTPHDRGEARKWFEKAAAKGHRDAAAWLNKGLIHNVQMAIPVVRWFTDGPPCPPFLKRTT